MIRRLTLAAGAALTLALLVAMPAAAGGWASVTIREGTPTEDGGRPSVGITLLQHGVTPVSWGEVDITAVNASTGERLTFTGTPRLTDGQWTTWIELPAGTWTVAVTHSELEVGSASGRSLTVSVPSAATGGTGAAAAAAAQGLSPALPLVLATLLLVMAASTGAYLLLRRRVHETAPARHGGLVEG